MNHRAFLVIVLAASMVLGKGVLSHAATLCVNPAKPACSATIQAAVDLAVTGDTVLVHPLGGGQAYDEQVVINTAGITIRGRNPKPSRCSKVYVDGCDSVNCDLVPFTVNAPNVKFKQLFIRHASPAILLNPGADGAVIDRLCFVDDWNVVDGNDGSTKVNNVSVTNSRFFGNESQAIDLRGDDVTVKNNEFPTTDDGILVYGDNMVVAHNNLRNCNDDSIELRGANIRLLRNTVVGCDDGPKLYGNNPTVQYNRVMYTGDDALAVTCCADLDSCDYATCSGGLIADNMVSYAFDDDEVMVARGDNLEIRNNKVLFSGQDGLSFTGNNGTIRGNTVTRSGTESGCCERGVEIIGNGNTVAANVVRNNSFVGIYNSGDGNTYRKNIVEFNGKSGIHISSGDGNTVDDNTIRGNHGEGISNGSGATNTIITDNIVRMNKTDVCNDGTVATFTGNTPSLTGGTTTPCVVQQ